MGAVVVKVGSSSITTPAGDLSDDRLAMLVDQLVGLATGGSQPVLVTSGAIAAGRGVLSGAAPHRRGAVTARRASPRAAVRAGSAMAGDTVADLQGLAAIGQGLLMARYQRLFAERGRLTAQILMTAHDFGDRVMYLNARRTVSRLLEWGVIPIVNENDTTATEEISLGENDRLAALVATLIGADQLVILTDTKGVFSADPRLDAGASLIAEVQSVDAELEEAAGPSGGAGSGGMATKVAAAKIASWSGIPCVIAAADEPGVLARAVAGEMVGTRVRPRPRRLTARKVWIAFACPSRGRVLVDAGAVTALRKGGRSLLPVGVVSVEGQFEAGDAVEVLDVDRGLVAKGLACCAATPLAAAAGLPGDELPPDFPNEAIHRDDLVVLSE